MTLSCTSSEKIRAAKHELSIVVIPRTLARKGMKGWLFKMNVLPFASFKCVDQFIFLFLTEYTEFTESIFRAFRAFREKRICR